jgi:WD40 repeat protein
VCLDYVLDKESGVHLLATGSRDRFLHIYNAKDESYETICSLQEHSSSITSLKFGIDED